METIILGLVDAGMKIYSVWKTASEQTKVQIEEEARAQGLALDALIAKYDTEHDERTAETQKEINTP
jgi:hypothetical protein